LAARFICAMMGEPVSPKGYLMGRLSSGRFAVLLSLLLAPVLLAQVSQKIDVRVVNVDVTVTDGKGEPVRGLTRDDFVVLEDGKPVELTNFYAVENASPPPSAAAPAAIPAPAPDERFRRKVLVLIDNAHVTKHGRDVTLAKLESFINDRFRGGEYDWSIATVGHRVHLLLPPTSDKEAIHDALVAIRRDTPIQKQRALDPEDIHTAAQSQAESNHPFTRAGTSRTALRSTAAIADNELEQTLQARFTVDAIVSAARAFAGAEGKKVILFLTGDPGLNDLETTSRNVHGDMVPRDFSQRGTAVPFAETSKTRHTLRDTLIREANASNVSFYVMNTEGLDPGEMRGAAPTNNQASFWLAEETGGRSMTGNDPALGLRQFDASSSNYYSLGYRPPHGEDGAEHKIDVRLKNGGNYRVHHRTGYSSVPAETQLGRALQSSMSSTMYAVSLPLSLDTGDAEKQKEGLLVPIAIKLPVGKLQFLPAEQGWSAGLDIYASVFDQSGKNVVLRRFAAKASAASEPDPTGMFIYKNAVLIKKGETYRIVAAVRDQATDAVGIASRDVRF
jgi:VWFA-related protein